MDDYIFGTEILGAGDGMAIVIKLRDLAATAREKGGALGAVAAGIIPKTIYSSMADKIKAGLVEEGVDASVKVVSDAPSGSTSGFTTGAVIGAGALGLVFLALKMIRRR